MMKRCRKKQVGKGEWCDSDPAFQTVPGVNLRGKIGWRHGKIGGPIDGNAWHHKDCTMLFLLADGYGQTNNIRVEAEKCLQYPLKK